MTPTKPTPERRYFELGFEASELGAEFGYSLIRRVLNLLRLDSPNSQLLVIEAKYEDLTRGFTQLVAELAALDQWENSPDVSTQTVLVGAVSTGTIWQFGTLDRATRHFEQGINSYRVTEDLEPLLRILIAALRKGSGGSGGSGGR